MPNSGPTIAFVLVVVGILFIYGEFIWVGKLVFGISGAISALAGMALLSRMPLTSTGLVLILGAVVCFTIESAFETYWISGTLGSVLCGWGFWKLCPVPPLILPQVAFPVSALFGAITTGLLSIAKRARRNKHSG